MSRAFFEAYYHTYNREDPEALRAFYHDELELRSSQGVLRGAEAVLDTYRQLIRQFRDQMTAEHISVSDGRVQVRIRNQFTAKCPVADFMGQSLAAGESMTLSLLASYQLRDGKIYRAEITVL